MEPAIAVTETYSESITKVMPVVMPTVLATVHVVANAVIGAVSDVATVAVGLTEAPEACATGAARVIVRVVPETPVTTTDSALIALPASSNNVMPIVMPVALATVQVVTTLLIAAVNVVGVTLIALTRTISLSIWTDIPTAKFAALATVVKVAEDVTAAANVVIVD